MNESKRERIMLAVMVKRGLIRIYLLPMEKCKLKPIKF